jgi:hypothetical protein
LHPKPISKILQNDVVVLLPRKFLRKNPYAQNTGVNLPYDLNILLQNDGSCVHRDPRYVPAWASHALSKPERDRITASDHKRDGCRGFVERTGNRVRGCNNDFRTGLYNRAGELGQAIEPPLARISFKS